MTARAILDRRGALCLARTGSVFEILWDGMFLMSSQCRRSERELGALACGRTLVAGLGMGFTLRAALEQPGVTTVDVVEIAQAVVEWNRGVLGELAGHPLRDERVRVHERDVAAQLRAGERYDAVLLDVDNGPSWTARPENDALYGAAGVAQLRAALLPGGRLGVWSAQDEPAFLARLGAHFERVESRAVPADGAPDHIIVAVARPA
jgi:spermidine synthase